ncbi:MAG: hypothetical protein KDI82_08405 [Gammaproteobacteria bacterium]|nr:hypothetical protein [Gammaproteobacteria bacterium]
MKKYLLGGIAGLALVAQASAAPMNVGGVIWDPDHALDFSSFSIAIHQDIDSMTGELSGYGFISTMNGTPQGTFCPGCEVTFTFSGFFPTGGGAILPGGVGSAIEYTGGMVSVYVDDSPEITNPADFTTLNLGNTSDGDMWLDLAGNGTFTGTVTAAGLSGIGQLDVTGGLAAGNFDTNTQVNGSDVTFSNSFTFFTPQGNVLNVDGTGNFFSDTIPVPAPLALLGLGLVGLGFAKRRLA